MNTTEQAEQTDIKLTPDDHSDIVGGSTAGRVIACPASVKLSQQVKRAHLVRIWEHYVCTKKSKGEADEALTALTFETLPPEVLAELELIYRAETTSPAAEEGTALHDAIAWILDSDEEPESVCDRTFNGHLITPTLYSEAIIPALDAFDSYLARVAAEDGEEPQFIVEKRCAFPGVPGAYGTSDIIGKTSHRIFIWDWKFGRGHMVSPERNDQLRFYGRAAINSYAEWVGVKDIQDDHPVDLIISQPRTEGHALKVWETDYYDLEEMREKLVSAIDLALGPNPPAAEGEHCLWCKAKHVCPAKAQLVARVGAHLNQIKAGTAPVSPGVKNPDNRAVFTPQDVADWLEDALAFEIYVNHIKELCRTELLAGRRVAGKKLVEGLGHSAWTVDDAVVDRRLAAYGIPLDLRRVVKPMSPTQAKVYCKGSEKHVKLIDKICLRPKTAPRVVDADAKGTDYIVTADAMASIAAAVGRITATE